MRVLSLFDGISGAQVALYNLGITSSCYFASEINQKSIFITQKNFPSTIQLGDINNLRQIGEVDLIIFGSPCTDLSVARKNRQSLAGKSSGLFYKAVEILKDTKHKYFLMENVASMSDESKAEISKILGVEAVEINSNQFLPQNRRRLYWCNWQIPSLPQPNQIPFRDKLLPLSSLADLKLSEKGKEYMARQTKDGRNHWNFGHNSDTDKPNSACIVSNFKKGVPYNVLLDRRVYQDYRPNTKNLWPFTRSFHPIECERLQGFPDNFTDGVAHVHRFESIGNAFTIPVIEFLLQPVIKSFKK